MKAIVMSRPGGAEVLTLAEIPRPEAGPGELLVRVHAVAVNPIDYKLRTDGTIGPKSARTPLPANFLLGFDVAGIVEAAGPGANRFKPGDRVFYSPDFFHGAYAEYNVTHESLVAKMPANLSFEQAAAMPLVGTTAHDALFARGGLTLGETALIAGASGGVGSVAVQLARAAGAFVLGTCSARSADFVKSIPVCGPAGKTTGPDAVLNYATDWAAEARQICPHGIDVVFDCAGKDVVSRSIPLMRPQGRIVSIVNPTGMLEEGYRRNIAIHYYIIQRRGATVEKLAALLERGQLVPLIDSVMPLEKAADAHRKLEAGGVQGKIVLSVR